MMNIEDFLPDQLQGAIWRGPTATFWMFFGAKRFYFFQFDQIWAVRPAAELQTKWIFYLNKNFHICDNIQQQFGKSALHLTGNHEQVAIPEPSVHLT